MARLVLAGSGAPGVGMMIDDRDGHLVGRLLTEGDALRRAVGVGRIRFRVVVGPAPVKSRAGGETDGGLYTGSSSAS